MAKMSKKEMIYGTQTDKVLVTAVKWPKVEDAIEKMLGDDVRIINMKDARKAVAEGKKSKHSRKTFVHVGLVKNDLVLRVRTKRRLGGDKNVDTILVKNARRLEKAYKVELERLADERDQARQTTDALPEVERAEAKLKLRQDMIGFQRDYRDDKQDQLTQLTRIADRIDDAVDRAQAGTRMDVHARLQVESNVLRWASDAEAVIKAAQRRHKQVTKGSSPLMIARGDHTIRNKNDVDPAWLAKWRRDFNTAFSDGDAYMQEANTALSTMRDTIRHIRARVDEVRALAGHMNDVIDVLARLDDVSNDLEGIITVATKKANQATGASSANKGLWSHLLADPVVAPPAALRKQFNQLVPAWKQVFASLPKGKRRLDDIERTLNSIPEAVQDEREVAREVGELRSQLAFAREEIDRGLAWQGSFRLLVAQGQRVLDSLDG